jgi:hypothetical protein
MEEGASKQQGARKQQAEKVQHKKCTSKKSPAKEQNIPSLGFCELLLQDPRQLQLFSHDLKLAKK